MVYIKRAFSAFRKLILKNPHFAEFSKFYFSERKKNDLCTPSTPPKIYLADNQVCLFGCKVLSWQ
jgi:hypothetical protein